MLLILILQNMFLVLGIWFSLRRFVQLKRDTYLHVQTNLAYFQKFLAAFAKRALKKQELAYLLSVQVTG